jgi:hypothetical protein
MLDLRSSPERSPALSGVVCASLARCLWRLMKKAATPRRTPRVSTLATAVNAMFAFDQYGDDVCNDGVGLAERLFSVGVGAISSDIYVYAGKV